MKSEIVIQRNNIVKGEASLLPASKSISNRVLIMNALSGNHSQLHNLSNANDTQLMLRLINSTDSVIDIEDAGTTMRFLTAYFAVTGKIKTLTGTARMQERPVGLLVDALRLLGAKISYEKIEGYPPIRLEGFSGQKQNKISIRGDVSSQYISALMMVAPILPQGLSIELTGKIGSRPYIEMTASLMKQFGINSTFEGSTIHVPAQSYQPSELFVESDWSAASYWFAFTALADEAEISLPHLSLQSLQGDHVVVDIMKMLGVTCHLDSGKLKLYKSELKQEIEWDFTHCPDLAQTVAVVCAAKGVKGKFTGLESLRIKETDRIAALQNELSKIGAQLIEDDGAHWTLIPSAGLPSEARFETYKDHRMAMAFAPLATKMKVTIENRTVVKKSYPLFWDDMIMTGFSIQ